MGRAAPDRPLRLPERRVVVRFDLSRRARARTTRSARGGWCSSRDEVDLCLKDPGFPVDVTVDADLAALTRVWMGRLAYAEAARSGAVRAEGPRALVRAFPGWLGPEPVRVRRHARRALTGKTEPSVQVGQVPKPTPQLKSAPGPGPPATRKSMPSVRLMRRIERSSSGPT